MSKLTPQTNASTTTPSHATITWPAMQLPEPDPRYGMTAEHLNALEQWYSSVQGAVNLRLSALSSQIETLKTQLPK